MVLDTETELDKVKLKLQEIEERNNKLTKLVAEGGASIGICFGLLVVTLILSIGCTSLSIYAASTRSFADSRDIIILMGLLSFILGIVGLGFGISGGGKLSGLKEELRIKKSGRPSEANRNIKARR